jgi:hypothetical protein
MLKEVIYASGHKNVSATHRSTFEITTDPEISDTADCIIGVAADKGAASLSHEFKAAAANDDSFLTLKIKCGNMTETVTGWGSSKMGFTDGSSMVFRVSDYVCGRTVMINADKPAARLNRGLVKCISEGDPIIAEMTVETKERPKPSLDILFY